MQWSNGRRWLIFRLLFFWEPTKEQSRGKTTIWMTIKVQYNESLIEDDDDQLQLADDHHIGSIIIVDGI